MIVILNGGEQTTYTDYSSTPVKYWDEYFYNTAQSNAIYRNFQELTYEGYDTILVGERQLQFTGYYFNTTTKIWQSNPFIPPSGNGTPRGGNDEPIVIGNGEVYTGGNNETPNPNGGNNETPNPSDSSFFGGLLERANGNTKTQKQTNPYTKEYTGTTSQERIDYLKSSLRWLEVEMKSISSQLERDLRQLKTQVKNGDEREIKIIEAAGIALTAIGGLKIVGIILTGAAFVGKLFNNSNASKVTLTESVRSKTELLNQYIADYKKLKSEYDSLVQDGGSSDGGGLGENKNTIYWVIGGVVLLGIITYFIVKKWQS